jgi:hypothetical protein
MNGTSVCQFIPALDRSFVRGSHNWMMVLLGSSREPAVLSVGLMGVPLQQVDTADPTAVWKNNAVSSTIRFLPRPQPNMTYELTVTLAFRGRTDLEGHSRIHVDVQDNSVTELSLPDSLQIPPILRLVIQGGPDGIEVPWETQVHSFTVQDFFTAIFSNASISLTVLAFLFPWHIPGMRARRRFVLDGDGAEEEKEHDDDGDDKRAPLMQVQHASSDHEQKEAPVRNAADAV